MGALLTERFRNIIASKPEKFSHLLDSAETPELTGHVIDVRQQDPTAGAAKASGFEQALASVLDRQDGM